MGLGLVGGFGRRVGEPFQSLVEFFIREHLRALGHGACRARCQRAPGAQQLRVQRVHRVGAAQKAAAPRADGGQHRLARGRAGHHQHRQVEKARVRTQQLQQVDGGHVRQPFVAEHHVDRGNRVAGGQGRIARPGVGTALPGQHARGGAAGCQHRHVADARLAQGAAVHGAQFLSRGQDQRADEPVRGHGIHAGRGAPRRFGTHRFHQVGKAGRAAPGHAHGGRHAKGCKAGGGDAVKRTGLSGLTGLIGRLGPRCRFHGLERPGCRGGKAVGGAV